MSSEQKLKRVLLERGLLTQAQILELKEEQARSGKNFEEVILTPSFLATSDFSQAREFILASQKKQKLPASSSAASPSVASLPMLPTAPSVASLPMLPTTPSVATLPKAEEIYQAVLPMLPPSSNEGEVNQLEGDTKTEASPSEQPNDLLGSLGPSLAENSRVQSAVKALEKIKFEESFAETLDPEHLPESSSSQTLPRMEQLRHQFDAQESAPSTQPSLLPKQIRETQPQSNAHCHACGKEQIKKGMTCEACHAFLKTPAANDKLIGKELGARFLLNGRLGEGGMGLVYHATDSTNQTYVAVKILPIQLSTDEKTIQRFHLEAKVMLELEHPNIVRAIDYGFEEEVGCYLVMELLFGQEFKDYLDEKKILSPEEIVKVFSQVCDAMEYAHGKGVIHRDLKPSNMFLMRDPAGPLAYAKVIDFGIARLTTDDMPRHTVTGTFLGTPQYMSPEQAGAKKDLDLRSDIYSLGIILFQTLTGRLPFIGDHLAQILMYQIYMQAPKLSEARPEIAYPESMQLFLARVLEKEPSKRPSSMQEFQRELREAMGDLVSENWNESELSNLSSLSAVGEKLVAAANTILSQRDLPELEEELEPQKLFENLALALRTPQQELASIGEVAVLMLSEEVETKTNEQLPGEEPSNVVGRIQPVFRHVSSNELPMAPSQVVSAGHFSIQKDSHSKVPSGGKTKKKSSMESELESVQKRKLAFMFIFAFVFFILLIVILWFSR